jgi:hypothetical protein
MGVLAWLGVPAGATMLSIAWVHWSNRPRGPVAARESVAEHERFTAALAAQSAASRRHPS